MSNQTNSQPRGEARKIETRGGINVRDLVNVAVFTVIYLIIFFAFAMAGIVPVMAVFYPLPIALIASIPNALFYTRGGKFGLVTIEGALLGLILFLTGMGGPLGLAAGIVCGLVADLIMRSGDYKSFSRTLVAHCIFGFSVPRRPCGCSAMPTSSPSGHRRAMRSSTAPWRCSAGPCSRSSSSAS